MSSHRFLFYTPRIDQSSDTITITDDEQHHLSHVLRLSAGDRIYATNGRGLIVVATLQEVTRAHSVAAVASILRDEPEPARIVLALALVRKDRFAQAVEQCVELGMSECIPFVSANAQVKGFGTGTLERIQRVALSAMRQSFRAHLPIVHPPVEFGNLVALARTSKSVFVGDQAGPGIDPEIKGDALIIIGPEAGLDESESAALANAGAAAVAISRHRLRSETAAVALMSWAARAIDRAAPRP